MQSYLKGKPSSSLIKITRYASEGLSTVQIVAPLPSDFGFTVGSEFSAPFDVSMSAGLLQKVLALQGISQKIGIRMRNMYANPVPTEISVELEFAAYNNAADDVVVPVVNLAAISLGTALDSEATEAKINKAKEKIYQMSKMVPLYDTLPQEQNTGGVEEAGREIPDSLKQTFDNISKFLGLIRGPEPLVLEFGNFIRIPDVYITSMAPQFSNVLDKAGLPMYCKCPVTFTLEKYPTSPDVTGWFTGYQYDISAGRAR
jgi:hypothetical protein